MVREPARDGEKKHLWFCEQKAQPAPAAEAAVVSHLLQATALADSPHQVGLVLGEDDVEVRRRVSLEPALVFNASLEGANLVHLPQHGVDQLQLEGFR